MQEINIILKLSFNGDIRRIRLVERNFDGIQKQIGQLYGIKEGSFSLKYKDDEGDQVTISSNDELNEAYRSIQRNILRIDVTLNKEKEEEKCGRFRKFRENCKRWKNNKTENQQPNEQFQHPFHPFFHHFQQPNHNQQPNQFNPFGFVQNMAQNLIEQGSPFLENLLQNCDFIDIEHNHVCDGCNSRIKGNRYHCSECSDFDFCKSCYETKIKTHPEHKFEEITAFQALQSALKNGEMIDSFFDWRKKNDVEQPKPSEETKSQESISQNNVNQETSQQNILEQQILEQEKIKQKLEQERLEKERLEKIEQQKQEEQKKILEQQKLEQQRLEQQRQEQRNPVTTGFEIFRDILFPLRNNEPQTQQTQPQTQPQPQESSDKVVYPFEEKLHDLQTMGFTDRKRNILALVQSKGDIQLAIEKLLN